MSVFLQRAARKAKEHLRADWTGWSLLKYSVKRLFWRAGRKVRRVFGPAGPGRSIKAPDDKVLVAVKVTGGVGDYVIIARVLRDISRLSEAIRFHVFCPSVDSGEWAFRALPCVEGVFDGAFYADVWRDYDCAMCMNQFAYPEGAGLKARKVTRLAPSFARALAHCREAGKPWDTFIEHHPTMDGAFARTAVALGMNRYTFIYSVLGLSAGSLELDLPCDPRLAGELSARFKEWITISTGFDSQFVVSSRYATKCYPGEHWEHVVGGLKRRYPDVAVVQIGAKTSVPVGGVDVNLVGRTSLAEAAGVIRRALLHVDNEGGLVHVAASLGVRSVVLFGPTSIRYFGYPENANLSSGFCGDCWWSTERWMECCPRGYGVPRCMEELDPARVLEAVADGIERARRPAAVSPSAAANPAPEARPVHGESLQAPGLTRDRDSGPDELGAHLALARPGTIVDAGAHSGQFTLPLAQLKGVRVVAFEPLPDVSQQLREELRARYGGVMPPHVQVYSAALGDSPGRARLSIPRIHGGEIKQWASIAKTFDDVLAEAPEGLDVVRLEVDVWTLDSLGLGDVTAMKVDVEGHELAVLKGAHDTILRCRPFITVELEERHSEGCTRSVPEYLAGLGYDGFFQFEGAFYPVSALLRDRMHRALKSPAVRDYSAPYIFEFYFVPREAADLKARLIALAPGGYRQRVDASRWEKASVAASPAAEPASPARPEESTSAGAPPPVRAGRLEYYRDLVLSLLSAELAVRYRNTVLGYAWSVLHPLMFTLVFLFAFKVVLGIRIENYTLFLVAGMFPWQAIQNSICSSTGAFLGNSSLIKRVRFPRHFLVMVGVLNDLIHYVLSLPIIGLMMWFHAVAPTYHLLWALPVLLAVQFLITLGVSLLVATCNLFLRDLERLVAIAMMLLFYLTPILYKEDMVPAGLRWVNYANPMASLVISWRHLFMGLPLDPYGLAASAGWAAAALLVGYGLYRKLNWRFGELV